MSSEYEELRSLILQMKTDLLAAIQASMTKESDKDAVQFAKRYIEKHGFITWSKAREDPAFIAVFRHNTRFHRVMSRYQEVFGWGRRDVEGGTYFYKESFDIDSVLAHVSWENHRPNDPRFLEFLIKEVIAKSEKGTINIFAWLECEYPQKGEKWRDEVVLALTDRMRRYYGDKIASSGDVFRVMT